MRDVTQLVPHPRNPNKHPEKQIKMLAKIMAHQGWRHPITISNRSGFIVAGHGRLAAAQKNGWTDVPVDLQDFDSEADEYAHMVADNKIAELAEHDDSMMIDDIKTLEIEDLELLGLDGFEIPDETGPVEKGNMHDQFGAPPFSVLDGRSGWWLDRKRMWIAHKGIKSELGRDEKSGAFSCGYLAEYNNTSAQTNISIFDPVLTELLVGWFCPEDGTIIDPFAGGSVRGIVSAELGRNYVGIELRKEQVDANRAQAESALTSHMPTWVCDDSLNIERHADPGSFDFMLTCPPYADLEVYSQDERDISNMDYASFISVFTQIIAKTAKTLKDNSFAAIVVGEVRDKKTGEYYNFLGDTIRAFTDAGLAYYNEMVLVTPTGTLPLRAGNVFKKSRKIGKSHQNVLVFVKGSWKEACKKLGQPMIVELLDE